MEILPGIFSEDNRGHSVSRWDTHGRPTLTAAHTVDGNYIPKASLLQLCSTGVNTFTPPNESQNLALSHVSHMTVADELAAECPLPLHKTSLNRGVPARLLHQRLHDSTTFHMCYLTVTVTYTRLFPQLMCKCSLGEA